MYESFDQFMKIKIINDFSINNFVAEKHFNETILKDFEYSCCLVKAINLC